MGCKLRRIHNHMGLQRQRNHDSNVSNDIGNSNDIIIMTATSVAAAEALDTLQCKSGVPLPHWSIRIAGIATGHQFSAPPTDNTAGTKTVRTTNVSIKTPTIITNPNWLRNLLLLNSIPKNARAIMMPAPEITGPVTSRARAMHSYRWEGVKTMATIFLSLCHASLSICYSTYLPSLQSLVNNKQLGSSLFVFIVSTPSHSTEILYADCAKEIRRHHHHTSAAFGWERHGTIRSMLLTVVVGQLVKGGCQLIGGHRGLQCNSRGSPGCS